MFARDATGAILPPLLIGLAVVGGGIAAHFAIGKVMSPAGADALLFILAGPGAALVAWAGFLAWFYRDPDRPIGDGVVSPADGRITRVVPLDDPDVGPATRVSIFMGPLDVHVNRAPLAARLLEQTHSPGGNRPAFSKDSDRNERLTTLWAVSEPPASGGDGTRLKLIQIAGTMARRIVLFVPTGHECARGERFGMIRLGSRVDVLIPRRYPVTVQAGDRVRAGRDLVAKVPSGSP